MVLFDDDIQNHNIEKINRLDCNNGKPKRNIIKIAIKSINIPLQLD